MPLKNWLNLYMDGTLYHSMPTSCLASFKKKTLPFLFTGILSLFYSRHTFIKPIDITLQIISL